MRKRRVILILLGVVVAGAIVVLFRREREPEYGGKRLSEWVEIYGSDYAPPPVTFHTAQAADAIRHIGTNSLPYLLKWIRYERPPWQTILSASLKRVFARINSSWQFNVSNAKEARVLKASKAFTALGPMAQGATGELSRLLSDRKSEERVIRAAEAPGGLGGTGLPSLLTALTNRQVTFRWWVPQVIGNMGTDARPAVPLLIQSLKDNDPHFVYWVSFTLGRLELEPDLVVPALVNSLRATDLDCRRMAASSLIRFGSEARSAVPALLPFLNDPDHGMRLLTTNALRTIDPEALERAAQ